MKRLAILATLLSASLLSAMPAAAEQVSGERLRDLVSGKRIYLATPFGGEFPLNYRPSGSVTGDGTALGLGKYFAPKETGRWWIDGQRLCQQWPSWYDGKATCFTITKTGARTLRWVRDDGRSGKARIEG